MQARDLMEGDVILMRAEGAILRTPHTVARIECNHGGGVFVTFTDGTQHVTSPRMPYRLVTP